MDFVMIKRKKAGRIAVRELRKEVWVSELLSC